VWNKTSFFKDDYPWSSLDMQPGLAEFYFPFIRSMTEVYLAPFIRSMTEVYLAPFIRSMTEVYLAPFIRSMTDVYLALLY
jgi:hypothetical protein